MLFATIEPQTLISEAENLQTIGSAQNTTGTEVAAQISCVVPAAGDDVSALTAALFSVHVALYREVSAQAVAMHDMVVTALAASADSYVATEAVNVIVAG